MIARLNPGRYHPLLRWSIFAGTLLVLLLLLAASQLSAQGESETRPRSARYCRRCHDEAYEHWANSAHNLEAFQGERFQSVWERQRQSPECLTCHTTQWGEGEDMVTYEAVTCAACHSVVGTDYDPDERDHALMSIPQDSRTCAKCHEGDHAVTYTEWAGSAHNGLREVGCLSCHDGHTGGLVEEDLTTLCGNCHMQPVPEVSAHMHVESGCTDCHPAPIQTDNIHMSSDDPAECTDCHMVTHMEDWGRWLDSAGHNMTVGIAACSNCHGAIHDLGAPERAPAVESAPPSMP
ncbi:MAG: hypothetical protein JXN59_07310 [Anaerolineae bacterium]|nr:hypothetical protein [Anaerolineae bacterium]